MEKPLVSVIVPVYNVSQYLRRCLDSIIVQSYKKLEIILVDDGSTDGSGKICDEYAEKDNRIRVIHKTNGGLSDARNTGLEVMTGTLVAFVDSDDLIHYDFFEILVSIIIEQNVRVAICGYTKFADRNEKSIVYRELTNSDNHLIYKYSAYETMLCMLYRKKIPMYSTGKLYDSRLFGELRFPKGKLYEDVPTTWNVINRVQYVVFYDFPLYFYRKRATSIVNAGFSHHKMDQVYPVKDIMDSIVEDNELYRAAASLYYFCLADLYAQVDCEHKQDRDFLEQELKKYGSIVQNDKNAKFSIRMLSMIGSINIVFIRYLGKLYKYYVRHKGKSR